MHSAISRTITALVAGTALGASLWLVPAEASTPAATYARSAFAATNHQRAVHHRVKLHRDDCLQTFARRWARRMALGVGLQHQSLGPVMRRCHLSWAGENIAVGYRTGRGVVNHGWMRSPGHRQNILRRQYRQMGLAAYRAHGRWWVSQVFGRER